MAKSIALKKKTLKTSVLKKPISRSKSYKNKTFKNTEFVNTAVMDPSYVDTALLIAGIVFGIVSFMHLLRLIFSTEIMVSGHLVPMWTSWVGFIISFILCIFMFSAKKIRNDF